LTAKRYKILGASQNVVLIKRFVSTLIFYLPNPSKGGIREVKVPPLEGFREVKVDKRQNEMHPKFSPPCLLT
jgi:hypothetical protein